jgi:uncharacterized protein
MVMDPVVHFEMPAEDRKRIAKFYSKAFGWNNQVMGEDMGGYVVATTTKTDKGGRPMIPGTINGGFYQKTDDMLRQHPSIVIAVEDLGESMRKVSDAGGKVIGEPTEIPSIGQFVSFFDTEGNSASMLQPTKRKDDIL